MSSVLIKGMTMPYGCANCPFVSGPVYDVNGKATYFCDVDVEGIKGRDNTDNVLDMYYGAEESFPGFCPLVEVKVPHGDLIDRNETIKAIGGRPHVGIGINDDDDEFDSGMSCQWGRDTGTIKDMPAIIKAEGSDT